MPNVLAKSILGGEKEQELVGEFLGQAPGTFVEVGANDPVLLSQTYHLEQAGWRGILIEPLRECAQRLAAARRARGVAVAARAPEDRGRGVARVLRRPLSALKRSLREGLAA